MIDSDSNSSIFGVAAEEHPLTIREVVQKYAYHWPVFLFSLFICISCAFIYLRYTHPIYSVNTTLLIKDEKKVGIPAGGDIFNELGVFGSSKVVDNEIEILKSRTLMRKVVERLNLPISIKVEGRLKSLDLYENSPVNIQASAIKSDYYGKPLSLMLSSKESFIIEEGASSVKAQGKLGIMQLTKFGVFSVTRNPKWKDTGNSKLVVVFLNPESVVDECLSHLSITLAGKQSTVLNLAYNETLPRRGQDILNTLIQVYNEEALLDKNKTTQSTLLFIDERLKLITGELTEVEKDVEGFKSSRGLTDISSDANLFLESVKSNDAKLNEINLQISVVKGIQRFAANRMSDEKLPSTLGIEDPVLLGQINQLSELLLKRDQLLATTTESNPVVFPLDKQIETTRVAIRTSISNILKTLEVSKSELERNNSEFQGSIKKIPGQERQLISIKRQQTIKESLYLYLLQKKEEAALSYASAVADSRTVDAAFYSEAPISPKSRIVYVIGLVFSFVFSIIYVFVKSFLNNKIEGISDLNKLTSTPIIGEVAFSENSEAIVVQTNNRTAISEQFRALRTNLQFLGRKAGSKKGNVILLTSSMSGEGKTFIASNIAAALSLSGKRTILLELDLRKPKVSKYLNLENKVGLSNFLIGQVGADEIIQATDYNPNFYLIGSGPIPPNPSELLIQPEIESLMDYLKDRFDEIIIDSPPIGLVTDAQILARMADTTIYVVRHKVTFKEQCKNLDQLFKQQKFPKLNVVLNGVMAAGRYGYGYGYYSDDDSSQRLIIKKIFQNFLQRL